MNQPILQQLKEDMPLLLSITIIEIVMAWCYPRVTKQKKMPHITWERNSSIIGSV